MIDFIVKFLFIVGAGVFLAKVTKADECRVDSTSISSEITLTIGNKLPTHLKGATIRVTLSDGKFTEVPAEKFMVVKRKDYIYMGENTHTETTKSCTKEVVTHDNKKNIVTVGVRKDHKGLKSTTRPIVGGVEAEIESNKGVVLDGSYYREDIVGPVGAGLGVDTNKTIKVNVGVGF